MDSTRRQSHWEMASAHPVAGHATLETQDGLLESWLAILGIETWFLSIIRLNQFFPWNTLFLENHKHTFFCVVA